jgi:hypothetical protein
MKSLAVLLIVAMGIPAFAGMKVGDAKEGYICRLDKNDFKSMMNQAEKLGAKSISISGLMDVEYKAQGKSWQKTFFTFVSGNGELIFADYTLDLDNCSDAGVSYSESQQIDIK